MSIASRLQEARERTGLNQAQAAERVGIDASTLSRYESGQRKIPAATLLKLCRLYGLSPTTLLPNPEPEGGSITLGNLVRVPVFEGRGVLENKPTEVSLVPISWLDPMEPEPPFFYRLKTSPIPAVPHNATLLVNPNLEIHGGDLVLASIRGQVSLRIFLIRDGEPMLQNSLGSDPMSSTCHILGRVSRIIYEPEPQV